MAGDLIQHVVEKGHAGVWLALAGAIEIEAGGDLRFKRIAFNRGIAHGRFISWRLRKQEIVGFHLGCRP